MPLPPRTQRENHLMAAGASEDCLVRVRGTKYVTTGRYLHEIEEWQVDHCTGHHDVEEWWPMPIIGTGNKVTP